MNASNLRADAPSFSPGFNRVSTDDLHVSGTNRRQRKRRIRRRNRRARQKHGEGVIVEKAGGDAVTIQGEDSFPTLGPAVPESATAQGDFWAASQQVREGTITAQDDQEEERDSFVSGGIIMSVLRSSNEKTDKQDDPNSENGDDASARQLPHPVPRPRIHRRPASIGVLRDRWWTLVKDRQTVVPSDDTDTTPREESTHVTESSFLEPVELVPFSLGPDGRRMDEPELLSNDEPHWQGEDPIREAILQDDLHALKILLRADPPNGIWHEDGLVQLVVSLDKPKLLRPLLTAIRCGKLRVKEDPNEIPALLLAIKLVREECLHILLADGSFPLSTHSGGRNILHFCCRRETPFSLLEHVVKILNRRSSLWSKLMMMPNEYHRETPLHVACQNERVDLVELFLGVSSYSLLSKVLVSQDRFKQTPLLSAVASGSVDIVVTFMMWRGNNIFVPPKSLPCPLVWAVRCGNIEVVSQLLEFSSPSNGYDLNEALLVVVAGNSDYDESMKLELINILVGAGANPCAQIDGTGTVLEAAVDCFEPVLLSSCLERYNATLSAVHAERRRDPLLRQQPESFFAGLESRDNAEKMVSSRRALTGSLFAGHRSPSSLKCSLVLYSNGICLDKSEFGRLLENLNLNRRLRVCDVQLSIPYRYKHETIRNAIGLQYLNSVVYNDNPWLLEWPGGSLCPFFSTEMLTRFQPDLRLMTAEGDQFMVHQSVVVSYSGKLLAAVNFCSASEAESGDIMTISMDMSTLECSFMLQHIYCGSIAWDLSSDHEECCQQLLSLIIVAEEFLCYSLVQECEVRLLSSLPLQCLCSRCTLSSSRIVNGQRYVAIPDRRLLPPLAVVDAIAVAEQTGERIPKDVYNISSGPVQFEPLEALLERAVETAVKEFGMISEALEKSGIEKLAFLKTCVDGLFERAKRNGL